MMMSKLLAEFTILGQSPRKSNSRQIVKFGNRYAVIKSAKALAYEKDFSIQVPAQYRNLELGTLKKHLRLDIVMWYKNRKSDLSIELIKDCLEKTGVIKNDRYIREEHIWGFVDKENPRITLRIYDISGVREIPFDLVL